MEGSAGQQRVQPESFNRFEAKDLNLNEQVNVAEILDTIDLAIDESKNLINKYYKVHLGLTSDLLTRGLDTSGACRDPRSQPDLFEKYILGSKPKDWNYVKIGQTCTSYAGGTPARSVANNFEGNIPWVKSSEVNQDLITSTEENLSQHGFDSSSAKWIPKNTVLIAMYGATAGQICWLSIRATTNQAVLALIPKDETIVGRFLFWSLKHSASRLISFATGSGQPNLSKGLIDNFSVLIPSNKDEQEEIAQIIDNSMDSINEQKEYLAKLQLLKYGLLDALISPENRVLKV
jgi:type I restriction enzyme S subunit